MRDRILVEYEAVEGLPVLATLTFVYASKDRKEWDSRLPRLREIAEQAIARRHKEIERDIAAAEQTVRQLSEVCDRNPIGLFDIVFNSQRLDDNKDRTQRIQDNLQRIRDLKKQRAALEKLPDNVVGKDGIYFFLLDFGFGLVSTNETVWGNRITEVWEKII